MNPWVLVYKIEGSYIVYCFETQGEAEDMRKELLNSDFNGSENFMCENECDLIICQSEVTMVTN